MSVLEIRDLQVAVKLPTGELKPILAGVNLTVAAGQTHAIMGPNGSGKSTLAYSIAGHPKYQITGGSVSLDGTDVLSMTVRVLIDGRGDFVDLSALTDYPQNNVDEPVGAALPDIFDTFTQNSQTSHGLLDYASPVDLAGNANTNYWPNRIQRYLQTNTGKKISVKAIQLQLRIWDQKTEQTRQVTVVVDL